MTTLHYIILFILFFNSSIDAGSLNKDHVFIYRLLEPDNFNRLVHQINEKTGGKVAIYNLRQPKNSQLGKAYGIENIICDNSSLVFSHIKQVDDSDTILKLKLNGHENFDYLDYILMLNAEKCILESSFIEKKSVQVVTRMIQNFQLSDSIKYMDLECHCLFRRKNLEIKEPHIFELLCGPSDDFFDIGGIQSLNNSNIVITPSLVPSLPFNKHETDFLQLQRSGNNNETENNGIQVLQVLKFNFSRLFWQTDEPFFGEKEVQLSANDTREEKVKYRNDKSKKSTHEENCSDREYQLILKTILTIFNKLLEHLENN
ncbi:signal peptide protein [Cryptosporidium felis]|nr:signal peptide protein [Cryptosporidium felis]